MKWKTLINMCYDISFKTSIKNIRDDFPDIRIESQLELHFNDLDHIVAQENHKYGIIIHEGKDPFCEHMLWAGVLNQQRIRVYNARSESLLDAKSLWYRLRKNRCLVPVTGIFEHRHIQGWQKKVPYHVSIKNRHIFYLPGLYIDGNFVDKDTGEIPRSFTLLTRKSNHIMSQIHNADPDDPRMPLFLAKDLEKKWISKELTDDGIREIIGYEINSEDLDYRPVFTIRSRKPRPDGKLKTDKYEWPKLPALEI